MDEGRRRKIGGSWELQEKNRETRRINRHIPREIDHETNCAMVGRPGAPWMCYFSDGAQFWDVLKTVA